MTIQDCKDFEMISPPYIWKYLHKTKPSTPLSVFLANFALVFFMLVSFVLYVLGIAFEEYKEALLTLSGFLFIICLVGLRMAKNFTTTHMYNLNAFFLGDDNRLYHLDYNDMRYIQYADLIKLRPSPASYGYTKPNILSIAIEKKRRKKLLKITNEEGYMERVYENRQYVNLCQQINRVTSILERKNYFTLFYTILEYSYKFEEGKEIHKEIKIYDNITNYDSLLKICHVLMQETKHLCKHCGQVMENGLCPICWSNTPVHEENNEYKKYNQRIVIFAILSVIFIGAIVINTLFKFNLTLNIPLFMFTCWTPGITIYYINKRFNAKPPN